MKKSLIWRFVVVAAVLAGWTLALFPIKDRPFLDVFCEMAEPQLADYRDTQEDAEAKVARLQPKMEKIEDKESEQYKELQAEIEAAQAEGEEAERLLTGFEELIAEAEGILREREEVRAPYRAVKLAAQGKPGKPPVTLNQYVSVPTIANASNSLVLSRVRGVAQGKLRLGLDLQGGTEFIIGFKAEDVPEGRNVEDVRDQISEIIRNRVDQLGVVEPEIKPTGPASISVRMPTQTEDDKADVRRSIKQTARLEFHLVHEDNPNLVQQMASDPTGFTVPTGYELKVIENEQPDGSVETENVFISRRPTRVRGKHVVRAGASFDQFNNWYVSLVFNDKGAAEFAKLTTENVGRRLAVVLDGRVYSAPVIRDAITGGQAQITGNFGPEEARRLAGVIESGNLPVSINIDSEFGTDPTLGSDSIRSGTLAAAVGLLLVLVFMILYYRIPGMIAVVALIANVLLVFGTLALTRATITLPGIAGVVLTIGMAVDANVLIFERIREEVANGKSLLNAVRAGYKRAFVTILDANLTTLITALILFRFGTGPIRGFAVTLSIGIVASMFTALFMTRAIFDLLLHNAWMERLSMACFIREPNFDFFKFRKIAFAVSGGLIVLSIGFAIVRGGNMMSIDFSGGTAVTFRVTADELPAVGAVRDVVAEQGYTDALIGYKYSATTAGRLLEVVFPQRSTNEGALDIDGVVAALNAKFAPADGEEVFSTAQTNSVGSLIGARFQRKALMAAIFAVIAIVIYISFRFEFAYGVASVIALVHDVLIAMGVYIILGRQISLPVVAALLTIMGYSLNDTIVVFDRIRENLGLLRTKTYQEIINLSINQTLSRTVLTSLTTLLVVLTLFLFGGGAINDFALVMLVGVVVGTYSSIFVASTIVAVWHKPSRVREKAKSAEPAV